MKNRKGFTLIELILVLTVTTILLGSVITIVLQSINYYKIDETKAANQDSLNLVSTSIEGKIRSASAVSSSCEITTATGKFTYSLNTTTHVLTLTNTITLSSSTLTDRIASFTCTVTGNVVGLSITTINDRTGDHLSLNTTIAIRKGD